jgi:hypothetical protein
MSSVASATRKYFQTAVAAVLPDDAYVWYGAKMSIFEAPITLEILGWHGQQVPAELSPQARREEEFELVCCITSFAGDQDFDARETEAVTQWNAVSVMIGNDYTLGGNVRWAQMATYNFEGIPNADGQSIGVMNFTIECQARIDSLD